MSATGADSGIKQGEVVPWADPRAELDDIKAQGIRGSELAAEATARLAAFTRAGRWRELLDGDYATVAEFLAAEFPMLAQLAIPVSPRRELVALMAGQETPQKAIAGALGVSQATVSGDLRIIKVDNSEPEGAGQGSAKSGNAQGTTEGKRGRGRPRKPEPVAGKPTTAPGQPEPGGRADPHADLRRGLGGGKPAAPPVAAPVPPDPVRETAAPVSPPVIDAEKAPCPGCRDLEAKLEAASAEIERLQKIRPDVRMAAELEVVTAQRDALLSGGSGRSEQTARPPAAPDPSPEAASGPPCAGCKVAGAPVAWELSPGGEKRSGHLCGGCMDRARERFPDLSFTRDEPVAPPVTSQAEIDDIFASFTFDGEEVPG